MDSFEHKLAVVTGAGDGMGRSLAHQLSAAGCHVALCDLTEETAAATKAHCDAEAPRGTLVTAHVCDVSDEAQLERFRDELLAAHQSDHVNLVFNNAGIAGGGSMVESPREQWERTFNVCWGGVYLGTRVFLPLLLAADEGHLINTSSVNGFWASIGPDRPHTSYSAAKFAVKGFSEALITDLRINAPHVAVSVVMPGHIGTGIAANSVAAMGVEADPVMMEMAAEFRNTAPMTADEAATVILEGVRAKRWRILVGEDAHGLDMAVRSAPEDVYDAPFYQMLAEAREARNQ
ncbi:MAG: SDR family NAD(P)-dependent oxidoreductase [Actinomycetota bacterium]